MNAEGKRFFSMKILKSLPPNRLARINESQLMVLIQANIKSIEDRRKIYILLYALLKEVYFKYHLDEEDERLLENEDEIRKEYGDWHYYFALKLAPFSSSEKVKNETTPKENSILQKERKLRVELQEKNDKLLVQIKELEQQYKASQEQQHKLNTEIEKLDLKSKNFEAQRNEDYYVKLFLS